MLHLQSILFTCFIIETLFYLFYKLRLAALQKHTPPPHFPESERNHIFERVLSFLKDQGDQKAQRFLSEWFFNAKFEDIWRENICEWIAWALYSTLPELLSRHERQGLVHYLSKLETRLHHTFRAGRNPMVRCARLTFDPIQACHRPLLFYLGVWSLRASSGLALRLNGFTHHTCGNLGYWHRPFSTNKTITPANPPLIFIHGIGIGLVPYHRFLSQLWSQQETFVLELPTISMQLVHDVFSAEILVSAIDHLMRIHQVEQATFAGHSFGSICVAWMLKRRPHRVHRAILLDPVCFLLFCSKIAIEFVYRCPHWNAGLLDWVVHILGKRELYIAHTLARNFWWFENVLWPEELPSASLIVLSGGDQITPADAIHEYLQKSLLHSTHNTLSSSPPHASSSNPPDTSAKILYLPKLRHAEFLFHKPARQLVVDSMLSS